MRLHQCSPSNIAWPFSLLPFASSGRSAQLQHNLSQADACLPNAASEPALCAGDLCNAEHSPRPRVQEKDDSDLEAPARRGASPSGLRGLSSSARRVVTRLPGAPHGTVSARMWLLVAYLVVLHLTVMFSFTKEHDLDALCVGYAGKKALPGT